MNTTASRVDYALGIADKLARGDSTWLTVKQTSWIVSAIMDAVANGANGEYIDHVASLRCSWNTHRMITVYVAPNHCGRMVVYADCQCGR